MRRRELDRTGVPGNPGRCLMRPLGHHFLCRMRVRATAALSSLQDTRRDGGRPRYCYMGLDATTVKLSLSLRNGASNHSYEHAAMQSVNAN
jgi:hypothetical protein